MKNFCEFDINFMLEHAKSHTTMVKSEGGHDIIYSRAGGGKSIKMLDLAVDCALAGGNPLIISDEMSVNRIEQLISLLLNHKGIFDVEERRKLTINIDDDFDGDFDVARFKNKANVYNITDVFIDGIMLMYVQLNCSYKSRLEQIQDTLNDFGKPITMTMAAHDVSCSKVEGVV